MKKLLLLHLMLFLYIHAFGQVQNVDSLINVLKTQKKSYEEQIDIYKKICNVYLRSNMDKLIDNANKGLHLTENKKDKSGSSYFYQFLGTGYYTKGDYDKALKNYKKALNLAIEQKEKQLEAMIYGSIANVYTFQNNEPMALEYNLKALFVFERLGDKKYCAITLCNISGIHEILQNEQQSVNYIEQARSIAEELNDNYIKSMVYRKLASIHSQKNEFDKAIEYDLKTLEYSRSIGDKQGEILSLEALAIDYCEGKEDCNTAEKYALECLNIAEELGDPRLNITAQNILSMIYLNQKRFEDCKTISLKVWESDSTSVKDFKVEIENILSNLTISYIHLANKNKAAYFFDKYQEIITQRTNENFQETMADMQIKYETEKKELHIASLEKEKQLYTYLGIGGVLFAITLGIVLWQNIRNAKKEKQLIATQSVMDGEMSERTRLARDLHDRLSGNLSAVKIELNNAESLFNISDKLDSCIEEVRRVAHNLMPNSLQYGLKTALEDFTAQFPNVHFHFFGEDNRFEERAEFVIYCCANELVNNSLKHSGAENINLQLVQDNKHVTLTVQDDGSGYDGKIVKKGLGLRNIYDRVISCNGKIDVISVPDKGTETIIELKIK